MADLPGTSVLSMSPSTPKGHRHSEHYTNTLSSVLDVSPMTTLSGDVSKLPSHSPDATQGTVRGRSAAPVHDVNQRAAEVALEYWKRSKSLQRAPAPSKPSPTPPPSLEAPNTRPVVCTRTPSPSSYDVVLQREAAQMLREEQEMRRRTNPELAAKALHKRRLEVRRRYSGLTLRSRSPSVASNASAGEAASPTSSAPRSPSGVARRRGGVRGTSPSRAAAPTAAAATSSPVTASPASPPSERASLLRDIHRSVAHLAGQAPRVAQQQQQRQQQHARRQPVELSTESLRRSTARGEVGRTADAVGAASSPGAFGRPTAAAAAALRSPAEESAPAAPAARVVRRVSVAATDPVAAAPTVLEPAGHRHSRVLLRDQAAPQSVAESSLASPSVPASTIAAVEDADDSLSLDYYDFVGGGSARGSDVSPHPEEPPQHRRAQGGGSPLYPVDSFGQRIPLAHAGGGSGGQRSPSPQRSAVARAPSSSSPRSDASAEVVEVVTVDLASAPGETEAEAFVGAREEAGAGIATDVVGGGGGDTEAATPLQALALAGERAMQSPLDVLISELDTIERVYGLKRASDSNRNNGSDCDGDDQPASSSSPQAPPYLSDARSEASADCAGPATSTFKSIAGAESGVLAGMRAASAGGSPYSDTAVLKSEPEGCFADAEAAAAAPAQSAAFGSPFDVVMRALGKKCPLSAPATRGEDVLGGLGGNGDEERAPSCAAHDEDFHHDDDDGVTPPSFTPQSFVRTRAAAAAAAAAVEQDAAAVSGLSPPPPPTPPPLALRHDRQTSPMSFTTHAPRVALDTRATSPIPFVPPPTPPVVDCSTSPVAGAAPSPSSPPAAAGSQTTPPRTAQACTSPAPSVSVDAGTHAMTPLHASTSPLAPPRSCETEDVATSTRPPSQAWGTSPMAPAADACDAATGPETPRAASRGTGVMTPCHAATSPAARPAAAAAGTQPRTPCHQGTSPAVATADVGVEADARRTPAAGRCTPPRPPVPASLRSEPEAAATAAAATSTMTPLQLSSAPASPPVFADLPTEAAAAAARVWQQSTATVAAAATTLSLSALSAVEPAAANLTPPFSETSLLSSGLGLGLTPVAARRQPRPLRLLPHNMPEGAAKSPAKEAPPSPRPCGRRKHRTLPRVLSAQAKTATVLGKLNAAQSQRTLLAEHFARWLMFHKVQTFRARSVQRSMRRWWLLTNAVRFDRRSVALRFFAEWRRRTAATEDARAAREAQADRLRQAHVLRRWRRRVCEARDAAAAAEAATRRRTDRLVCAAFCSWRQVAAARSRRRQAKAAAAKERRARALAVVRESEEKVEAARREAALLAQENKQLVRSSEVIEERVRRLESLAAATTAAQQGSRDAATDGTRVEGARGVSRTRRRPRELNADARRSHKDLLHDYLVRELRSASQRAPVVETPADLAVVMREFAASLREPVSLSRERLIAGQ